MSEHLSRVVRGAVETLAGSGLSKISLIVFEFTLVANLSLAEFGQYALIYAIIVVLSSIAQLGFGYAAIHRISTALEVGDRPSVDSGARIGLAVPTLCGALLGLGVALIPAGLAELVFGDAQLADYALIVGISIPLFAFCQAANAVLRSFRRMRAAVIAFDGLRNLVLLIACFVFIASGFSVERAIWTFAAGSLAGALYALYAMRGLFGLSGIGRGEGAAFREMLTFAKPLILWDVMLRVSRQLSVLIAGVVLSSAAVGIFAFALRFAQMLNIPQRAVNSSSTAEFAALWAARDTEALRTIYQKVSIGLLLVCGLASILLLVDPAFLASFFDPSYGEASWILWPIITAKLLNVASGPAGQVFVVCDQRTILMKLAGLELVVQFVVTVPLAILFGVGGVALGEAARGLATVSYAQFVLHRRFGFSAYCRDYLILAGCLAAAILAGIAVAANRPLTEAYLLGGLVSLAVTTGLIATIGRSALASAPLRLRWARG